MQIFSENPMLTLSVIVFFACVIIGYFGEKRLKKKAIMNEMLDNNQKEEIENKSTSIVNSQEDTSLINNQNTQDIKTDNDNLLTNIEDEKTIDGNNSDIMNNVPNNTSYEIASEISADIYPPENFPQDTLNSSSVNDDKVNLEDNIKNIF